MNSCQERTPALYGCRVPKMPDAHLAARRDQILTAAMRRFANGGFHSTGMAEVIAESGLSAGAVYRYFASKEELIRAIVQERVLPPAADAFGAAIDSGLDDPAEAVVAAIGIVETVGQRDGIDITRIAMQAWAEALRNPQIHQIAREAYVTMRGYFTAVATRALEAGKVGAGSTPDEVAKAMFSMVVGYVMQRLVTQDVAERDYAAAVRALLRPDTNRNVSGQAGRESAGGDRPPGPDPHP